MKIAIYLSLNKSREVEIGRALQAGFVKHGDEVEIRPTAGYSGPQPGTQLAVMVGVKGQSKKIFEDHRMSARHTLLVDKSYFGRGEYYRLSLDGFQPYYAHLTPRDPARFEGLRLDLKPMRAEGRHVIYAGSSQKYCDWHDLGDVNNFARDVCHQVNKTTRGRRELYYRPKPSWAAGHMEDVQQIQHTIFSGPGETLASRLPSCQALVTHGSNAAIEAIIAGIPVVLVSREGACAAWTLAEKALENIERPFFPSDERRRQVFADLAWCQFTLAEIASGVFWETLIPHTIKGIKGLEDMNELECCHELYKLMHRGAKVFRGSSLKGHTEAVTQLVKEFAPTDLLDYGSGKGRQYDELNLHERWGGLKPVCYDPGWEPYAQKPQGRFDGVICTDVAEHIPPAHVDEFLLDVIGYGKKFVFFCIFTNEARKQLPDGRNCHLTVRPAEWWLDRIATLTKAKREADYLVTKVVPGGTQDFPHYRFQVPGGPAVVATFRGDDE